MNPWPFHQRQAEQDLDEEIRSHIEIEIQENRARGLSPEEARYAALRKFGNITLAKESTPEPWGPLWLSHLQQDLRYALRTLRRSPAFAAVAILSLALGIGANTAIFSMMDTLLWKALPVKEPSQLVWVTTAAGSRKRGIPYDLFREARNGNEVFSGMLDPSKVDGVSLTADGGAERVVAEVVSSNYFSVLGINAVVGRAFSDPGDQASWQSEAVLSHDFWKRRFSRDRNVIGKTVQLNGYPFTIVGVSPPSFFGLEVGLTSELRVPTLPPALKHSMPARNVLDPREFSLVVARLKPGISLQQAQAETDVSYQRLLADHPQINADPRFHGSHIQVLPASRG